MLSEAQAEFEVRGFVSDRAAVGTMMEVPSAALTGSLLAREVDFFTTLGTVDEIEHFLLGAFGRQDAATEVNTP